MMRSFLSTPSARRATATLLRIAKAQNISIHALREEGDYTYWPEDDQTGKISIHALREEGDAAYRDDGHGHRNFYPRPPRGGRRPLKCGLLAIIDFYPRPPRGGRRARYFSACGSWVFLSTPSARRATLVKGSKYFLRAFLSTPSARRATYRPSRARDSRHISIHALREEGDSEISKNSQILRDFYPRPPRGGRPQSCTLNLPCYKNFYPRPPRGGRHHRRRFPCGVVGISIHALREEGDEQLLQHPAGSHHFYPRPPRGGRLERAECPHHAGLISIHALREEGDTPTLGFAT